MAKIGYKLFDGEVEVTRFDPEGGRELTIRIEGCEDGFISIDDVATRLKCGVAAMDIRLISDGEFTPALILKNARLPLPRIRKSGSSVTLSYCDEEYVRGVSLRGRELQKKVSELEESIEALKARVYGTTIF